MEEAADPDDLLLGELGDMFGRLDPVPRTVIEAGHGAYAWRRVDTELAELLADSAAETESTDLALVRSGELAVRAVSFGSDDLAIELEIHPAGDERTLLGQLSPPARATVQVERFSTQAAEPSSTTTDEFGRFQIQVPSGGDTRLRITDLADGGRPIVTSWIVI